MSGVSRFQILKLDEQHPQHTEDEVVVEEPLEIRINGEALSITMRTPGDDFDLAVGLLWTEGVIESARDIGTIAYCENEDEPDLRNVVNVTLTRRAKHGAPPSPRGRGMGMRNSSCGLCGKAALEEIRRSGQCVTSPAQVDYETLCLLPGRLRAAQANFERTGGIHAAGLFDLFGNPLFVREDLGRHNAVDKVLGAALRAPDFDFSSSLLAVSGRFGFEIAQKALAAGIPVAASVSAPSSLAIELANDFGITVIGFLRGRSMNIYTHSYRVIHAISKSPA